jgi:Bacterial EndoU nuclease
VLDYTHRTDAPGEPDDPDARSADQFHSAREDLRARLGQLPDGHPSAADYRASADDRPDRPKTPDARRDTEQAWSGWEAPDCRHHPDRPVVSEIHIPPDRARHILDGDGPDKPGSGEPGNSGSVPGKPGGGHRHGTGLPDKTEFPESWSDEVILSTVEQVACHPDAVERQSNARWRVTGEHDSVRVTAVIDTDGRIRTAWPEPGGPGVRRNPKDGGA